MGWEVAQEMGGDTLSSMGFVDCHRVDDRRATERVGAELEELFDICDRIAVLAGGRLSPARLTGETNAEEIGRWMAGLFGERAEHGDQSNGEPPTQTVANA